MSAVETRNSRTTINIVLRWSAALVASILVYFIVLSVVALVWANFGGNALTAYKLAHVLSTVPALIVGCCIVPRSHWKLGFVVLAALVLILPTWLLIAAALSGKLHVLNIYDVGYTVLGLVFAYQTLRVSIAAKKKTAPVHK